MRRSGQGAAQEMRTDAPEPSSPRWSERRGRPSRASATLARNAIPPPSRRSAMTHARRAARMLFVAMLLSAADRARAAVPAPPVLPAPVTEAWRSITGANIARHVAILASDEYEGREPGT